MSPADRDGSPVVVRYRSVARLIGFLRCCDWQASCGHAHTVGAAVAGRGRPTHSSQTIELGSTRSQLFGDASARTVTIESVLIVLEEQATLLGWNPEDTRVSSSRANSLRRRSLLLTSTITLHANAKNESPLECETYVATFSMEVDEYVHSLACTEFGRSLRGRSSVSRQFANRVGL